MLAQCNIMSHGIILSHIIPLDQATPSCHVLPSCVQCASAVGLLVGNEVALPAQSGSFPINFLSVHFRIGPTSSINRVGWASLLTSPLALFSGVGRRPAVGAIYRRLVCSAVAVRLSSRFRLVDFHIRTVDATLDTNMVSDDPSTSIVTVDPLPALPEELTLTSGLPSPHQHHEDPSRRPRPRE